MAAPELVSRLQDIPEAIAAIAEYTAGKTFDDHTAERMIRDAAERNVERISEASRHIPKGLKSRHPEIPWRNVAGIGNILRHAYRSSTTAPCGKWSLGTSRPSERPPSRCCATPDRRRPCAMTGREGLVQVVERIGSPSIATIFRPPAGGAGTDSHGPMDPPKETLAPEG